MLVCGTQKKIKGYEDLVHTALALFQGALIPGELELIEGCCKDSADEYAETYAKQLGVKIQHHPSTKGNYLKRNIEMVKECDSVLCFWDGFSYGSCHTVATAVMNNKPVKIIRLEK